MSTQSPFFVLQRAGRGKGRRAPLLRTRCFRGVLKCREVHRSDSQGGQAGRSTRGTADEDWLHHQPEDSEGARANDPAVAPAAGGPGDRV